MVKRLLCVVLAAGALAQSGRASAPPLPPAAAGSWVITVADLGLLPSGSTATARGINNLGTVVGLATDASFAIRRVLWDASGAVVGELPNYDPSSTATPSSINDGVGASGQAASTPIKVSK